MTESDAIITVNRAQCIQGLKQPFCQACAQICPEGAIYPGAIFTPAHCERCGLCTAVCPTGAICTRENYAQGLQKILRQGAPFHFACQKRESQSPFACLGFLTRDLLWAFCQQGETVLDLTLCEGCTPEVAKHIRSESSAVYQVSESLPLRLNHHAAQKKDVSRRGFFRRFLGMEALQQAHDELQTVPPPEVSQAIPFYPRAYARQIAFNSPFAPRLTLYEECNACGLCARFCKAGALQVDLQGNNLLLTFQPSLCSACGICEARCPKHALSLQESDGHEAKKRVRWQVPLPLCARCQQPYQPIGTSKLCQKCLQT